MVKLSNHILRHRRLFPCLIVFLIISVSQLMVPYPLYAASQEKNLLIINSYNESAPWVQSYITPFMLEAANNDRLNCNLVHMNSTLVRTDFMYHKIENGVFDRFKHNRPDFLVLIGKMAFSLRDCIKSEWGDIPMLSLGVDDKIGLNEKYLSGDSSYPNTTQIPLSEIRGQYVKGEFRVLSEDGGKKTVDWMEVNAFVSKYNEHQRPEELIGSLLLITARKQQEANLTRRRTGGSGNLYLRIE